MALSDRTRAASPPGAPAGPDASGPAAPAAARSEASLFAARSEASLFGRRDLLTRGGLVALSAALLGGAGIALRTLWPRAGKARALTLEAGRPEEYQVGQLSARLLAEHQLWVLRTPEGFVALSAVCTHLGCKLRHVPGVEQFRCMCHGSYFSGDGDVVRGPATRPMERVHIRLTPGGELRVDPGVRYRKERGEWSLPGALAPYPGRRG